MQMRARFAPTIMVKSYAELEAKHRSPKSEDKPADEAAKPNDLTIEPAKDGDPGAKPRPTPITTAFEAFAKHYEETKWSARREDQIAEIVKLGVPQSIVDNYLAGLSAMSQLAFQQAHATAGGEDVFNAASDWASKSLTAAEIDSYNTLVTNLERPPNRASNGSWRNTRRPTRPKARSSSPCRAPQLATCSDPNRKWSPR